MKNKIIKSLLSIFCVLPLIICLSACDKNGRDGELDLLLTKKVTDTSSFFTDGIAKVTLKSISDGDTADFMDKKIGFTARFAGVNTPESTGQIEKWGKAASNYTKDKLEHASGIIAEAVLDSNGKPSLDTNNSRYMTFVWYMPKDSDRYYNLNFELVKAGYSDNTLTVDHEYYEKFNNAYNDASINKRCIHSDEEDPLYHTTLKKMSLKVISDDPSNYDQAYVQVEVSIVSVTGGTARTLRVEEIVDGKRYYMDVYLGYGAFNDYFFIEGNKLRLNCRVTSHYGKWQLAGVEYSALDPNSSKCIKTGNRLVFNGYAGIYYNYDYITVTEVSEESDFFIVKGTSKNQKDDVNVNLKINKSLGISLKVGDEIQAIGYNNTDDQYLPTTTELSLDILVKDDVIIL